MLYHSAIVPSVTADDSGVTSAATGVVMSTPQAAASAAVGTNATTATSAIVVASTPVGDLSGRGGGVRTRQRAPDNCRKALRGQRKK